VTGGCSGSGGAAGVGERLQPPGSSSCAGGAGTSSLAGSADASPSGARGSQAAALSACCCCGSDKQQQQPQQQQQQPEGTLEREQALQLSPHCRQEAAAAPARHGEQLSALYGLSLAACVCMADLVRQVGWAPCTAPVVCC
jgi:hypothetical protein